MSAKLNWPRRIELSECHQALVLHLLHLRDAERSETPPNNRGLSPLLPINAGKIHAMPPAYLQEICGVCRCAIWRLKTHPPCL